MNENFDLKSTDTRGSCEIEKHHDSNQCCGEASIDFRPMEIV